MLITEEAPDPPDRVAWHGRQCRLAFLLQAMVPAGVALAKTAAAPKPRMAFIYFPHGAVMDKWTPKTEGSLGGAAADPEAARSVQEVPHGDQRAGEQVRDRRAGARDHAGHVAFSCVPPRISHEPYGGITDRPDRREAHRPGHAAAVAGNRRPKSRAAKAPATATTGAATARRFRSAIRRRRCRWSTTRASCSSSCSALGIRKRSAQCSRGRARA